jgi:NAD(P)H dehydrogenase (quinone)
VTWHVPYISNDARVDFLRQDQDRLQHLESDQPLEFVRLDQFDERLAPLPR